jgi:hypothetical protein
MTRRVYSERYGKPIDQISASQVFAGILQRLAQKLARCVLKHGALKEIRLLRVMSALALEINSHGARALPSPRPVHPTPNVDDHYKL